MGRAAGARVEGRLAAARCERPLKVVFPLMTLGAMVGPVMIRVVGPTNGGSPPVSATVFAAGLLMLEAAVRDELPRADSIQAMAARFGVSQEAMRWRLYNFEPVEERPGELRGELNGSSLPVDRRGRAERTFAG